MTKIVKLECQVTGNILRFSNATNFEGYTLAHANLTDDDNNKLIIKDKSFDTGEWPVEFVFDLDDLEHTVSVLRKLANAKKNESA